MSDADGLDFRVELADVLSSLLVSSFHSRASGPPSPGDGLRIEPGYVIGQAAGLWTITPDWESR
jgi:hypothetical protein